MYFHLAERDELELLFKYSKYVATEMDYRLMQLYGLAVFLLCMLGHVTIKDGEACR